MSLYKFNVQLPSLLETLMIKIKQESPPAGNRKRRTTRGIICPSISYPGVGGGGTYLGQDGTYLGRGGGGVSRTTYAGGNERDFLFLITKTNKRPPY